jgi:hypothetical protein
MADLPSEIASDPLVHFLTGGLDIRGRTLQEVLDWNDRELELRHDYIQWLFPLPEPSHAVPASPILTAVAREWLRAKPDAIDGVRAAAARMQRFYENNDHWLVANDHNHLRISRIIRSLRLIVGDADADAFRTAILDRVDKSGAPVPSTTREYWEGGLGRLLQVDADDVPAALLCR